LSLLTSFAPSSMLGNMLFSVALSLLAFLFMLNSIKNNYFDCLTCLFLVTLIIGVFLPLPPLSSQKRVCGGPCVVLDLCVSYSQCKTFTAELCVLVYVYNPSTWWWRGGHWGRSIEFKTILGYTARHYPKNPPLPPPKM
jgi:membrane-bound ClpP family serine protease